MPSQGPLLLSLLIVLLSTFVSTAANSTEESEFNIYLEMTLEELAKIEVETASKSSESITVAPATIYVITARDIISNGYYSLAEALENVPGVVPIHLGFFAFGGQRGFLSNFSQTLIMLNGREMQNLIAAETFISNQFATHNIKQIEVINGPGSALYGANAFVGVINIITKNDSPSYEGVELQLDYGSQATSALSLVLGKTFGDLRISGSARIFETDNWDFGDFVQDTSNFSEGAGTLKQTSNNVASEGYLNHSRAETISFKVAFRGFYAGTETYYLSNGKGLENVAADYNAQRDYRRFRLNYFGWDHEFTDQSTFNIEYKHYKEWFWGNNFLYSDEDYQKILDERQVNGTSLELPLTNDEIQDHFLHVYGQENSSGSTRDRLDLEYHTRIAGDIDTIFGLTYDELDVLGIANSRSDLSPPFDETVSEDNPLRKPFYKTNKKSLYVQLRKPFLENKLNITLGGRRDEHSSYGGITTFRSGIVYQAGDKTFIKALFGQAFRETNIFEQGASNPPDVPPNTELQPAEIDTYEVALNHSFGKMVNGNFVVYTSTVKNSIVPVDTLNFTNSVDEISTSGLEAQLFYKLGAWSGDLSYTYIAPDSSQVNGESVSALNNYKNRIALGINYDFMERWRLHLRTNYFDSVKAEHGNPSIDKVFTIDSATKVDMTLSLHDYEYSGIKVSFQATIKNLFDKQYFQANVRNGGPKQFLQPGRQFISRVIFKF